MRELIGRTRELDRLRRLLDELADGSGTTLVIRGDAGVGKTALLGALLLDARSRGFVVAKVVGVEGGESFGYQAAGDLLRQVAPVEPGTTEPETTPTTPTTPTTVARDLARHLGALAATGPVVVCLDDAHWFDASSAEAFVRLSQLLFGEPVAIVAATRPEPEESARNLVAGAAELLEVGALDRSATRALLEASGPIASEVVETCWTIAGGNPLALQLLHLDDAQRRGATPIDTSVLRSAVRLDQRFGEAVVGLGAAARRFVAVLAVSTLDLSTARRAAGVDDASFDEAVTSGLVTLDPPGFRHPLVRPAVLDRLEPAERRAAHAAIAAALTGRVDDAERRAWHLAASIDGHDADASEELAKVALAARTRGAVRESLTLFERAAELHPDSERAAALLVEAASAAWYRNESARAEALLDRVDALDPLDHAVAARADEVRAHVTMWTRGPHEALPILDAAVRRVEDHLPDVAISLLAVGAVFSQLVPDGRRALDAARRAEQLAGGASGFGVVGSQFAIATAGIAIGDADVSAPAFAAIEPVVALLADANDPEFEHVLGAYAALILERERWSEARALLEKLLLRADRTGATAQSVLFSGSLSTLEWFTGDWLRALAFGARNAVTPVVGPVAWSLGMAKFAVVQASLGLADDARASAEVAEDLADRHHVGAPRAYSGWARGLLALGEGDPDAAVAALEIAAGITERSGMGLTSSLWWLAELAEALWQAGRVDAAADVAADLRSRTSRSRSRAGASFVARMDALLTDDPGLARSAFERSEQLASSAELPFAVARTVFARAQWLARQGDADAAGRDVVAARRHFDRLGAAAFSRRAASMERTSMERTSVERGPVERGPADRSTMLGTLSPAELRVVEVMVRGRTIRQAADELVLSAKTVDSHLQQIYRKLGIRSRAELAARFERARAAS